MLKDISCSPSCNRSRHRAQDPGTTLEQLITVGVAAGTTSDEAEVLPGGAEQPRGQTVG
jgi:hypothetical protein